MCHEVDFVHGAAPISSIPAWRRFVTVDVIEPPGRLGALEKLFCGSPFLYSRIDDESDEPPPLRLGSPNLDPLLGTASQYTLTRVFPILTQDDWPINLELPIHPDTAIGNIALW